MLDGGESGCRGLMPGKFLKLGVVSMVPKEGLSGCISSDLQYLPFYDSLSYALIRRQ